MGGLVRGRVLKNLPSLLNHLVLVLIIESAVPPGLHVGVGAPLCRVEALLLIGVLVGCEGHGGNDLHGSFVAPAEEGRLWPVSGGRG